jgi:hypothetical protein
MYIIVIYCLDFGVHLPKKNIRHNEIIYCFWTPAKFIMHIFFIIAFVQNETRDRFFCELKVSDNFCGNCATIVPLVITLTFLVNYCIGVQKK